MNKLPDTGDFLGHPKGLYICFATEMWERFSFYGMKFLLLLYLTKYHLFSDAAGLDVLGAYAGLVYALPVIGGLIADRYLGTRRAVMFGGILLCIGHLLMAVEGEQAAYYAAGTLLTHDLTMPDGSIITAGTTLTQAVTQRDTTALNVFYLAVTFIVAGVGFLKPNISVIVGKLYSENDPRRDSGFTLFYMGINVGAFIATLTCGWLGETYGWKYGFGLAGVGMLFGLATFAWGQKYLRGFAEASDPQWLQTPWLKIFNREQAIYLATLPTMVIIWLLVQHEPVVHITQNIFLLMGIVGILAYSMLHVDLSQSKTAVLSLAVAVVALGVAAIFAKEGILAVDPETAEAFSYGLIIGLLVFIAWGYKFHYSVEFSRTLVLMILIVSTIVFWALFEQSSSSMTLFTDRVVDREVLGFTLGASQVAALNPAFIMLLSVPLAILWPWLAKRNLNPSAPVKFSLGIIQAGLGFGALVYGAQHPDASGKVALIWIVLAYFFHSFGELCLSPIGLSAVTKLSIGRVVSVSMGTWFVATSLSETLAARLSKIAALDNTGDVTGAAAIQSYSHLFSSLMWVGIGVGVFMLLISPFLKKGMKGIN